MCMSAGVTHVHACGGGHVHVCWGGPCARLQGTVLTELTEDLSTVGGSIPWAGNSGLHDDGKSHGAGVCTTSLWPALDCGCHMIAASSSSCLDFPAAAGTDHSLAWKCEPQTCSHFCLFSQGIYYGERTRAKAPHRDIKR